MREDRPKTTAQAKSGKQGAAGPAFLLPLVSISPRLTAAQNEAR